MEKILYVTSEVTPFAASGGLGDVMGALPRAVRRQTGKGTEIGVLMPLYSSILAKWRGRMRKVFEGYLPLAWRQVRYTFYSLRIGGVIYYFVENERYFTRDGMYGEYDDGERFAFFGRAAIELMLRMERPPDILHANDWQSALAVIYLRTLFREDSRFFNTRTVFTVHNIEYQGKYDPAILCDVFDLHPVHREAVMHGGCINLMKGALVLADHVTTVSRRYAEELCTEEYSFGLSEVIRSVRYKTSGILNGIDTAYFSPSDAGVIPYPYTVADAEHGKAANKAAIRKELGLCEDREAPLLVMVTRLTAAKGIDLVLEMIDSLLSRRVQLVILGTGDKEYEQRLSAAVNGRASARVILAFDRDLSKRLYAAADLFLMPSRSEPCGLAQMVACRFGTIPVVRATGGLADSIVPFGERGACGFVFENYNAHELLRTVLEAVRLYTEDKEAWRALRDRAMRTDFTWRRAAGQYLEIYENLVRKSL